MLINNDHMAWIGLMENLHGPPWFAQTGWGFQSIFP